MITVPETLEARVLDNMDRLLEIAKECSTLAEDEKWAIGDKEKVAYLRGRADAFAEAYMTHYSYLLLRPHIECQRIAGNAIGGSDSYENYLGEDR